MGLSESKASDWGRLRDGRFVVLTIPSTLIENGSATEFPPAKPLGSKMVANRVLATIARRRKARNIGGRKGGRVV